jgi:hypothetical protein
MVQVGDIITSRGGSEYECIEIDEDGNYFIRRGSTSVVVKITARSIQKLKTRIMNGETFKFQKSPTKGGISNTIAYEAVLAAICGLAPNFEDKVYEWRLSHQPCPSCEQVINLYEKECEDCNA